MSARSPRTGDTYRGARRNGSGALTTHSRVLASDIKALRRHGSFRRKVAFIAAAKRCSVAEAEKSVQSRW